MVPAHAVDRPEARHADAAHRRPDRRRHRHRLGADQRRRRTRRARRGRHRARHPHRRGQPDGARPRQAHVLRADRAPPGRRLRAGQQGHDRERRHRRRPRGHHRLPREAPRRPGPVADSTVRRCRRERDLRPTRPTPCTSVPTWPPTSTGSTRSACARVPRARTPPTWSSTRGCSASSTRRPTACSSRSTRSWSTTARARPSATRSVPSTRVPSRLAARRSGGRRSASATPSAPAPTTSTSCSSRCSTTGTPPPTTVVASVPVAPPHRPAPRGPGCRLGSCAHGGAAGRCSRADGSPGVHLGVSARNHARPRLLRPPRLRGAVVRRRRPHPRPPPLTAPPTHLCRQSGPTADLGSEVNESVTSNTGCGWVGGLRADGLEEGAVGLRGRDVEVGDLGLVVPATEGDGVLPAGVGLEGGDLRRRPSGRPGARGWRPSPATARRGRSGRPRSR